MSDDEAISECERWLAHLEKKKQKAVRMQELAAMARAGNQEYAQRELRQMDRTPTVYDGAKLAEAVEHLLKMFKREQPENSEP